MDIKAGITTAFFLSLIGIALSLFLGIRSIQRGKKLVYFRLRQKLITNGWRLIFMGFGLIVVAIFLSQYGEPIIYTFYKPSPTPTLTPTITQTPTITLTPTITFTPTITETPSITETPIPSATPSLPMEVQFKFTSNVAPNPAVVFSPMVFSRDLDLKTYTPIDEGTLFEAPVQKIIASFSYDGMNAGAQWSVLWYRGEELISFETQEWVDNTGGYGYSELDDSVVSLLPGDYQVQIFVGFDWKTVGFFRIEGDMPTITPTPTASKIPTNTATRMPTLAPTATQTKSPTRTISPSKTAAPTATMRPSLTPTITHTAWPTTTSEQ